MQYPTPGSPPACRADVKVNVSDMHRSIAFHRDALGLSPSDYPFGGTTGSSRYDGCSLSW